MKNLRHSLDYGNTFADAASMLCRDEDEVRQRPRSLGWSSTQASGASFSRIDIPTG